MQRESKLNRIIVLALSCAFLLPACGLRPTANPTSQPTSTLQVSVVTPQGSSTATETAVASRTPSADVSPTPARITTDDIPLLTPLQTLTEDGSEVTDVALSADGTLVVAASQDGMLRLWRTADGTLIWEIAAHTKTIRSVDISPDGSTIVSGSDDRTVRLWRTEDGTLIHSVQNELLGRVIRVVFSADGKEFAAGGHRCIVELRATRSGNLRRTLAQPYCSVTGEGQVDDWGLAFSADGSQIISGEGRPCCGGSLQRWEMDSFQAPQLIRGYDLVVRDVAISPDGGTLAVALVGSSSFWLLDLQGNEPQRTLTGHRLRVNDLEFSADGEIVASASRDGRIGLWDAASGEILRYLEGDGGVVISLDFSAEGSLLVSGYSGGWITLWGVQ